MEKELKESAIKYEPPYKKRMGMTWKKIGGINWRCSRLLGTYNK